MKFRTLIAAFTVCALGHAAVQAQPPSTPTVTRPAGFPGGPGGPGGFPSGFPGGPAAPGLPEGTTVHRDLAYVENGHDRQKLDLYLPKREADAAPLPLVIYVHGGAWMAGDKGWTPATSLLSEGYAVASIGYRLAQDAIYPAQIEDCRAAVRWLRANAEKYGLDPDHFAAWGESAGGHLVALLGTTGDIDDFVTDVYPEQSSAVQAVIDGYGPTDLTKIESQRRPGDFPSDPNNSPEARLIGGNVHENPEKAARANPITYVSEGDAPFLILHGDNDPLVPHAQSELLEAALKEAGVPVQLYTVKGGGHGGFQDPRVDELIREFLAKHLKGEEKAAE